MADLIPPVAPRLPAAPTEYAQRYGDDLTNILRLYFNQLDNTIRELILANPVPFDLRVARGQVTGWSSVRVNGYNPDVGNTTENIWPHGNSYTFPAAAATMTLYSTVVGDTTQTVLIQGLDSAYLPIQEVLVLNGQTGVATTKQYLRINRMRVTTGQPTGIISLGTGVATAGVPANIYGFMAAGDLTSQMGVYTVAAASSLLVTNNTVLVGGLSATQFVTVSVRAKNAAGTDFLLNNATLANGSVVMPIDPEIAFPEKTDVYYTGKSSTGSGVAISVAFSAYLVANSAA